MYDKLPIVLQGQVYFDTPKNDYLVVTKTNGEDISYSGVGFRGMLDVDRFVDIFLPVDPIDLTADEASSLLSFCPPNTTLKVGFIKD